ncbi:amidohydrolase [Microlunatus endophyticus]|uniref:Amidohydrolase n=2 Tax=Microlunatus endophyticus TaxID=1716077 RepID=A0A917SFP8_9ACTN|nr:amidohydrolase [Microlunatus endophyticus]
MGAYWVVDVRRPGEEQRLDLHVADGRVTEVVDHQEARPGRVIDADGRWLIPGLFDGHVHATQYAIDRSRIGLVGVSSAAEAVEVVAAALDRPGQDGGARRAAARDGVPVVGARFRDGLWPDVPTTRLLDERFGDLPVIMVSGDLHCGWANRAGWSMLGITEPPEGVLREKLWMDALGRIPQPRSGSTDELLDTALREAAGRGLVGLRDFEFADNLSSWERRRAAGGIGIRVQAGIIAEYLAAGNARGLRTGDVLAGTDGLVTMGPLKVLIDGSLNTRTAYCHTPYPDGDHYGELVVDHDSLVAQMQLARQHGLEIAVHAIGDRANTIALDCFEETGIRGRIEHAQLVLPADLPRFAQLGVTASMQPWHAIDDWEIAGHYWGRTAAINFGFASLAAAGATIEFGSDAPVAPLDPWGWIAAAVDREPIIGRPWHAEEQVSVRQAIAWSALGRAEVRAGDPGDFALLDQDPYALSAKELTAIEVHATAVAGRWVHGPDAE